MFLIIKVTGFMGKKLTYKFVKERFEKEGYILLTKVYENCYTKLKYRCSNDHIHSITWDNFKKGKRCPYCSGNARISIGFIKDVFKRRGYILLTKKYRNNSQKLKYICPKGHKHSTSWANWRKGARCPYCIGQNKPTIEHMKLNFEKENYTLLSSVYKNNRQKLYYSCPVGHKHFISWNNWQQGKRCPYCEGNAKLTMEFIKSEFESERYELLTTEYKNIYQKLDYICPRGHRHSISWNNWKQRKRCPTCASINHSIKFSGKNHWCWKGGISCEPYCQDWTKEFKEFIKERDGYKCQNPYCSSKNLNDLTVHHIDYNKKNCGPENLITICRSCNSKANTDRIWHTSWYKAVLYMRYGYK